MADSRVVPCPQCRRPVAWEPASRWRPFCSERCKILDLGAWAAEAYRVPVTELPDPDDPAVAEEMERARRLRDHDPE